MRYFLDISYKGTAYHGWQTQPNSITIQAVIEEKLSVYFRTNVTIVASGRTDTGVHATQQFVHLDLDLELNPDMLRSINKLLPYDISINNFFKVINNASARFDAIYRLYEYRITTVKNPFLKDLAMFYPKYIDLTVMNSAAHKLLIHDDFQCFSKVNTDVNHFKCKIEYAQWEQKDSQIVFTIKANRFLRGMVRAIVGSLIDVGLGKSSVKDFENIIESKDRKMAGQAAPPHGLFLHQVFYPESVFIKD